MSFEEFINGLTPEQMEKLKQALNATGSSKPTAKTEIKQLPDRQSTGENFTTIKQERRGREPVKAKKNTWEDHGEFRDDENLRMPKVDPSPRSREKSKKVEVECHVCGKTFFEDPRYIYGEYMRCSRCGRK